MGCAASTVDGAGQRRRGWPLARAPAPALESGEASTTGLLATRQQGQEAESAGGGRRVCKVAPEPNGDGSAAAVALQPMPGSPSFRFYCQKTAAVDKILAEADDSDGSVRIRATAHQTSNRNDATAIKAQESTEVPEHKEGTTWLRFRGLSIVAAAWHNLFSRHSRKPSLPAAAESHSHSHSHPPAAAALPHP